MTIKKLVAGAKGAAGNSTGADIADAVNGLIDGRSQQILPRLTGIPLVRNPSDTSGINTTGSATKELVTRNGRRCWKINLPNTNGIFDTWMSIPAGAYDSKIQYMIELEDAAQFNTGSVRITVCTDNTFTNGVRIVVPITTTTGWSGTRQIVGDDADYTQIGTGTWGTISAAASPTIQFKWTTAPTVTKRPVVYIYEVVRNERDNLPMIVLGADDGHVTWYESGLPILEKYNFKSYLAYTKDFIGQPVSMTLAQWQDAVINRGHEAVVHGPTGTKASLRDWFVNPSPFATAAEGIDYDIKYNKDNMVADGLDPSGLGRMIYVYPQGHHQPINTSGDDTIINALKANGFKFARLAAGNKSITLQPSIIDGTSFYLPIIGHWYDSSNETGNINTIIAKMQSEVSAGRSVIIMFHRVRSSPSVAEDISPANLERICAAAALLVNQGVARRGVLSDLMLQTQFVSEM